MLLLLLLYGNRKRISLEAVSIYSLGVDLKAVITDKDNQREITNKKILPMLSYTDGNTYLFSL